MTTVFAKKTAQLLGKCARAKTADGRGKTFEDLLCHLFGSIRGVSVRRRNKKNPFHTEEIDVALWNDQRTSAVPFLPWLFMAECKNWASPVGSEQVSWFNSKLDSRGVDLGILFAANGITGDPLSRTDAHSIVAKALSQGRRILVLTADEARGLKSTSALVTTIKEKLCDLVVAGTSI